MSRFTRISAALLALAFSAVVATGCGGIKPASDLPAPKADTSVDTTETSVFYSTGRSLLEERKVVGVANQYETTLKELLLALPESNEDIAIVQPETGFKSVTFDKKTGVLTVDWNKEVLDFEAEPKEKRLAFASLLMTFGQFPEVKKVKFTVEGKATGSVNGHDIQAFWGDVSLKGQPFTALRPPEPKESKGEIYEEQKEMLESEEASSTQ